MFLFTAVYLNFAHFESFIYEDNKSYTVLWIQYYNNICTEMSQGSELAGVYETIMCGSANTCIYWFLNAIKYTGALKKMCTLI